jgi:hypothetical protein
VRYLGAGVWLDLFLNHFLKHVPIQRQIGYQTLQAGVRHAAA